MTIGSGGYLIYHVLTHILYLLPVKIFCVRIVQFANEPGYKDSFISGVAPYYYTHTKGAFCVSETQLHLAKLSVTETTEELSSNRKQTEHCWLVSCCHVSMGLNPEPLDRSVRTAGKDRTRVRVRGGKGTPAACTTEDPPSGRVTGLQRCDICKVGTRGLWRSRNGRITQRDRELVKEERQTTLVQGRAVGRGGGRTAGRCPHPLHRRHLLASAGLG